MYIGLLVLGNQCLQIIVFELLFFTVELLQTLSLHATGITHYVYKQSITNPIDIISHLVGVEVYIRLLGYQCLQVIVFLVIVIFLVCR